MLNAYGQPHQFGPQPCRELLLIAELRVRCTAGMDDQALGITHIGQMGKEFQPIHQLLPGCLAALHAEYDHAACPMRQIAQCQIMRRITRQARITNPVHRRMIPQKPGHGKRVFTMALHAQMKRFQPLQKHPGVVG